MPLLPKAPPALDTDPTAVDDTPLDCEPVPTAVELLPDPRRPEGISAFAHRCREFRRGTNADLILRDEALEELARPGGRLVAALRQLIADTAV